MQVEFFAFDDEERLAIGRRYYNGSIENLIEWIADKLASQGYTDEAIAFEVRMKRKYAPQTLPVYPNGALAQFDDQPKLNITRQYVYPNQAVNWVVNKLIAQGYVNEAIQFKIRRNMLNPDYLPFEDIKNLIQSNELQSYEVSAAGETRIQIKTINGDVYSGRVNYDSATDQIYAPSYFLSLPSLPSLPSAASFTPSTPSFTPSLPSFTPSLPSLPSLQQTSHSLPSLPSTPSSPQNYTDFPLTTLPYDF